MVSLHYRHENAVIGWIPQNRVVIVVGELVVDKSVLDFWGMDKTFRIIIVIIVIILAGWLG